MIAALLHRANPDRALPAAEVPAAPDALAQAARMGLIGLVSFLTLVDLFATQAILPSLARLYGVTPAAMGLAVNASTLGMAVAGLAVALMSHRLERRRGVVASLVLLSIPTVLLAGAPGLAAFAALRVLQGLCMATAFSLTLAHLGETTSGRQTAAAFAAYVTGNVASNLVGRLVAAALADHFGVPATFAALAAMNLAGAALVRVTMARAGRPATGSAAPAGLAGVAQHLRNPALRAAFGIGFCILFAFIGAFTYVNFVLVRPPIAISQMAVGFVYFVFLPSIVTTPLAGLAVARLGARRAFAAATLVALAGLALVTAPRLDAILAGLTLVAAGTFFAQAVATGFVGKAATGDRGSASGLYLGSYFTGGLVGSAVLGWLFDGFGWTACVAGVAAALVLSLLLSARLVVPAPPASVFSPKELQP
ncbi:MFS transporter [Alsobacter sp. SYSU BS001988]